MYSYTGGKGGYAQGTIVLKKGDSVYVAVGGAGVASQGMNWAPGGWNGGGNGRYNNNASVNPPAGKKASRNGSGGGATSMQLSLIGDGQLKEYETTKNTDVLIVAGGGGGSNYWPNNSSNIVKDAHYGYGGAGGGETGEAGTSYSPWESYTQVCAPGTGGTQEKGGTYAIMNDHLKTEISRGAKYTDASFGTGGSNDIFTGAAGGGAGWYGGGSSWDNGGGGGGSGHIGAMLLSGETVSGSESFASPSGGAETGHAGNGYARITLIKMTALTFIGWNTAPDGSGTTYKPGDPLPNANLNLHAQWG